MHSLADEADRRLAEMSRTNPKHEEGGRCITHRNQINNRSPRGDKTPLNDHHISIADELGSFSENEDVPADCTSDLDDHLSEGPNEEADPLEEVDLCGAGRQLDPIVAGPLDTFDCTGLEPPSNTAIEVSAPEQIDASSDPVNSRTFKSQDQTADSNVTKTGIDSETHETEEQNPRRSRLDKWLDDIPIGDVTSVSEIPHLTSPEHVAAQEALSEYSQERSASITDLPRSIREPSSSQSTKIASIHSNNHKLKAFPDDDVWNDIINFDIETNVESFGDLVRVQHVNHIEHENSIPPLPQSAAWQPKTMKLDGKDLREFIESAVYRTNAILRRGRDQQAAKMVRDIQLLVERVLVGETDGERTSFGDELDGSAWRV